MIGWLIRATIGTVVMGFAGYTFVAVPVGRRTMFEHVIAISQTRPAQEMADDVKTTAGDAVDRVRASLDKPAN